MHCLEGGGREVLAGLGEDLGKHPEGERPQNLKWPFYTSESVQINTQE